MVEWTQALTGLRSPTLLSSALSLLTSPPPPSLWAEENPSPPLLLHFLPSKAAPLSLFGCSPAGAGLIHLNPPLKPLFPVAMGLWDVSGLMARQLLRLNTHKGPHCGHPAPEV